MRQLTKRKISSAFFSVLPMMLYEALLLNTVIIVTAASAVNGSAFDLENSAAAGFAGYAFL